MFVNTEGYFSRFQRAKRSFYKKANSNPEHGSEYALAFALLCLAETQAERNAEKRLYLEDQKDAQNEMLAEMRTMRRISTFNVFRGHH
jgi:hypothetical protein